jgi:hypothetical protein
VVTLNVCMLTSYYARNAPTGYAEALSKVGCIFLSVLEGMISPVFGRASAALVLDIHLAVHSVHLVMCHRSCRHREVFPGTILMSQCCEISFASYGNLCV